MRVQAAPREDFGWLCSRTGLALSGNARGIKAVDDSGQIRGLVAYDNWTTNACQAHMAVDAPIVWRHLLGPAFGYPFTHLGVLIGIVPSHHAKSLALVRHFGFRETHRIRDGWARGDDLLVFEMRKEECRWLGRQRKAA